MKELLMCNNDIINRIILQNRKSTKKLLDSHIKEYLDSKQPYTFINEIIVHTIQKLNVSIEWWIYANNTQYWEEEFDFAKFHDMYMIARTKSAEKYVHNIEKNIELQQHCG